MNDQLTPLTHNKLTPFFLSIPKTCCVSLPTRRTYGLTRSGKYKRRKQIPKNRVPSLQMGKGSTLSVRCLFLLGGVFQQFCILFFSQLKRLRSFLKWEQRNEDYLRMCQGNMRSELTRRESLDLFLFAQDILGMYGFP